MGSLIEQPLESSFYWTVSSFYLTKTNMLDTGEPTISSCDPSGASPVTTASVPWVEQRSFTLGLLQSTDMLDLRVFFLSRNNPTRINRSFYLFKGHNVNAIVKYTVLLYSKHWAPLNWYICNLYIVPSRYAVDYCYLLCEMSFLSKAVQYSLRDPLKTENDCWLRPLLSSFYQERVPCIQYARSLLRFSFPRPTKGGVLHTPCCDLFSWLKCQHSLDTFWL